MHVLKGKNMLKGSNEDSATRYKINLILRSIIPERQKDTNGVILTTLMSTSNKCNILF